MDASPPSSPVPVQEKGRSRWRAIAIAGTCTAAMLVNSSNGTSVAIALPTIGASLHAKAAALQWLVSAYSLSSGCLLLFCGHLADVHGRKRVFVAGSALLAVFTLGCGFVHDEVTLAVLRGLQGIGGAATIPAALGILAHEFPPSSGRARAAAFSSFSAGAPIGGALGMVFGGLVTQLSKYTWRAQFWLSAAIAFAVLVLAIIVIPPDPPLQTHRSPPPPPIIPSDNLASGPVPDTYPPEPKGPDTLPPPRDTRTDWPGAVLSAAGLILLVFVLGQGSGPGLPPPRMVNIHGPPPPPPPPPHDWMHGPPPPPPPPHDWVHGPPPPPPSSPLGHLSEQETFWRVQSESEPFNLNDELEQEVVFDVDTTADARPHHPPPPPPPPPHHPHGPPPPPPPPHHPHGPPPFPFPPPPPPHHHHPHHGPPHHHHHGPPHHHRHRHYGGLRAFIDWLLGRPPPPPPPPHWHGPRNFPPPGGHPSGPSFPHHGGQAWGMARVNTSADILSLLVLSIVLLCLFVLWEFHLESVHSRPGGALYDPTKHASHHQDLSEDTVSNDPRRSSASSASRPPLPVPGSRSASTKSPVRTGILARPFNSSFVLGLKRNRFIASALAYAPPPLLPPSLFARRRGRLGFIYAVALLQFGAFMIWAFWVQLYYQVYIGYSPVRTVVRLVPMFVTGMICNVVVALIVGRVPTLWLIVSGTLTTTVAPLLFALIVPSAPYWAFGFPAAVCSVVGADFLFAAGTIFVADSVAPHEQSVGGGIFQTMTQLGTSFGVTASTIVFNHVQTHWGPRPDALGSYQAAMWTGVGFGGVGTSFALSGSGFF
ncbi:MFS domain-containing protein [Favolaschia claudopus]|uniref:MFS domain-containing protein n=1 Tax=Favolaschia claudopus TaxID=2862362 RepID=A0AAW0CLH1_9AGAR